VTLSLTSANAWDLARLGRQRGCGLDAALHHAGNIKTFSTRPVSRWRQSRPVILTFTGTIILVPAREM